FLRKGGPGVPDPSNPQSWNRYAYVLNQPMAMVDPFGLDGCAALAGGSQLGGFAWWCDASYQGAPPGSAPGCSTSYCPGQLGGAVWNDPLTPGPTGSNAIAEGQSIYETCVVSGVDCYGKHDPNYTIWVRCRRVA